ncbi:MAG: DUF2231 domain-containing protein [Xanthomonadaceae bacterium]|nr:DUF2231 domain-containing protein [Xanthomonadaceae bacterium]
MKHPAHPALVHFPIACWSLASCADGVALLAWPAQLHLLAAVLIAIGCGSGLLAAVAGFVELLKLPAGHPAERAANFHMSFALASGCLYAGSLFLRIEHQQFIAPDVLALLLSGAGLLVLLVTGWLGGQLVYRHGVGVAGR